MQGILFIDDDWLEERFSSVVEEWNYDIDPVSFLPFLDLTPFNSTSSSTHLL